MKQFEILRSKDLYYAEIKTDLIIIWKNKDNSFFVLTNIIDDALTLYNHSNERIMLKSLPNNVRDRIVLKQNDENNKNKRKYKI